MKVSTKMQIERELREYKKAFKKFRLDFKEFISGLDQWQLIIMLIAPIAGMGWGGMCVLLTMGRPVFMACYVVFSILLVSFGMLYNNYQEEVLEWVEQKRKMMKR